jgi:iron complex outermembrane receptor protein
MDRSQGMNDIAAVGYLDVQASYDLTDTAQLVIIGSNLTNSHDLAYEGTKARLLQVGSSGRWFSIKASLRW